ncbi:MAG: hypothetical protein Fur0046_32960 [Cyanobacteria bacterium J069]
MNPELTKLELCPNADRHSTLRLTQTNLRQLINPVDRQQPNPQQPTKVTADLE